MSEVRKTEKVWDEEVKNKMQDEVSLQILKSPRLMKGAIKKKNTVNQRRESAKMVH